MDYQIPKAACPELYRLKQLRWRIEVENVHAKKVRGPYKRYVVFTRGTLEYSTASRLREDNPPSIRLSRAVLQARGALIRIPAHSSTKISETKILLLKISCYEIFLKYCISMCA